METSCGQRGRRDEIGTEEDKKDLRTEGEDRIQGASPVSDAGGGAAQ